MVFENLTLFEVSLEGAQLGPRSIGRSDANDELPSAGRPARLAPVMAIAVLVGIALLWRRTRRAGVEAGVETEADLVEAR